MLQSELLRRVIAEGVTPQVDEGRFSARCGSADGGHTAVEPGLGTLADAILVVVTFDPVNMPHGHIKLPPAAWKVVNPPIVNPSIANPSIANPSIANPPIANPSIVNPSIANPPIANPEIANLQSPIDNV